MANPVYSKFDKSELILRDQLAIDRTLLANERTLLAYLRAAVALLIAGASIMHFSQEGWFFITGACCVPTAVITGVIGISRYRRMSRSITFVRTRSLIEKNK